MTKYVLLAGILVAALLTLLWVVFTVLPSMPNTGIARFDSIIQTLRMIAAINSFTDPTPFKGIGKLFQFWFICLLIAIGTDSFIKPAAKAAVSAFASSLSPFAGQVACEVTQESTWRAELQTTTSGGFRGRSTNVLVYQRPNLSYLRVEMECQAPWVLDIRLRNLASEALAFVGAPVKTGNEALDEAVVIQGDDEVAVREWARSAHVHPRILSLLRVVKITSLTTGTSNEGGPVLQAHSARFRPRLFPLEAAVRILDDLAVLAESAEAGRFHGNS
jgi:hypothetical protein